MPLVINRSALNSFLTNPAGPIHQHARNIAEQVANRAGQLTRSRRIANALQVIPTRNAIGLHWRVVADVPFAAAEEEGSVPHIIRARNTAALHFFWQRQGNIETFVPRRGGFRTYINNDGVLIVGKGFVLHPGTTGTHFLSRALSEVMRGG